jgi:hypothetical protein
MDEALISIVEQECAPIVAAMAAATLEQRIASAFKEARTSCASMSKNDQFRGAILVVYNLADTTEKRRIDAELRNIELVAEQTRTGSGEAIPILTKPIGLTALWKKAKP